MRIYSSDRLPSKESRLAVTWKVSTTTTDRTLRPSDLTYGTDSWGSLKAALIEAAKYPLTQIEIVIDEGTIEEDVEIGFLNLSHITLRGTNDFAPEPEFTKAQVLALNPSIIKGKFNLYECSLPKISNVLFDSNGVESSISRCVSIHVQSLIAFTNFDPAVPTNNFTFTIRSSNINFNKLMIYGQKGLRIYDGSKVNVSITFKIDCTPDTVPADYNSDSALLVDTSSILNVVCLYRYIYSGSVRIEENSSILFSEGGNFFIINTALTGQVEGLKVSGNSYISLSSLSNARIVDCHKPVLIETNSGLKAPAFRVQNTKDLVVERAIEVTNSSNFNITGVLQLHTKMPTVALYLERSNATLAAGFNVRNINDDSIIDIRATEGSTVAVLDQVGLTSSTGNHEPIYRPAIGTIDKFNNKIRAI